MILVYSTFLAGILYYLMSKEERARGFAVFLQGAFLGVISCIVLNWISLTGLTGSASVIRETMRIYLHYFLIPMLIAIPLFLLFSFSLSEETFFNIPALLLGLFTVLFISATFTYRNEPETFRLEILLLLMFTVVFLSELLLKIFLSFGALPEIVAFLIAIGLLLVLCFPLSLVLGFYYFNNARFLTFIIAAVLLALLIVPQRIVTIFK